MTRSYHTLNNEYVIFDVMLYRIDCILVSLDEFVKAPLVLKLHSRYFILMTQFFESVLLFRNPVYNCIYLGYNNANEISLWS